MASGASTYSQRMSVQQSATDARHNRPRITAASNDCRAAPLSGVCASSARAVAPNAANKSDFERARDAITAHWSHLSR